MRRGALGAALLCSALLISGAAGAQQRTDPIDRAFSACLAGKTGQTTVGQEQCADDAARSWQRALDKTYGALLAKLHGPARDALVASQRNWLALRRSDQRLPAQLAHGQLPTLIPVELGSANVETLRSRVMLLRTFSDVEAGSVSGP